jgi:uncharacterized membrane protein YecN with MAPEG domain
MTSLEILPEHGYVILCLLALGFHCFLQGSAVAKVRYRVFSEDYVKNNLQAESEAWRKHFGEEIKKGCHPDNGLGRLSDKLSIGDWGELQLAQRAHLNYLETLPWTHVCLFFAGLFFPVPASIIGVIHLVGRQLYSWGFRKRPNLRGPGFGIAMLTLLIHFLMAVAGSLRLIGLVSF